MIFTSHKKKDSFEIKEEGRNIFTIAQSKENKLLSIELHNLYGDNVLSFHQVKKWYSILQPNIIRDFTIYCNDEKLGELHKMKDGYDLQLYGIHYYFYGGMHAGERHVICFDRKDQVADFLLTKGECRFTNGTFNDIFSMLMYVFAEVSKPEDFPQEAFLSHYIGIYQKDLFKMSETTH